LSTDSNGVFLWTNYLGFLEQVELNTCSMVW